MSEKTGQGECAAKSNTETVEVAHDVMSKESLESYFKGPFVSTDNLKRQVQSENERIMEEKASLLIVASAAGGRFAPFVKEGEYGTYQGANWIFKQKKHPTICNLQSDGRTYNLTSLGFTVDASHASSIQAQESSEILRRINGENKIEKCDHLGRCDAFQPDCGNVDIDEREALTEAFRRRSYFDLLKEFTPYDTPAKACRFFGVDAEAYGEFKKSLGEFRIDVFNSKPETLQSERLKLLRAFPELKEPGIFLFKDRHGETVQKLIAFRDFAKGEKHLLPLTCWMRNFSLLNRPCLLPLPEGQILYNLDLIMRSKANKENKTIILTDSVEIAEANQRLGDPRFIWTSWLCDETSVAPYKQVDWEPLIKAGPVYYLVTNHSGKNLGQAYIDAYNLSDFLEDEYDINLKFIQVESSFDNNAISSVLKESVLVMDTFEEFEPAYKDSIKLLSEKPKPWWFMLRPPKEGDERLSSEVEKRCSGKLDAMSYLMRPCLERGEITLLHAPTGLGKSAFAYSLCASVVSGEPLFREKLAKGGFNDNLKCWLPASKNKPFRKVLYLDYELGPKIENRKTAYAEPYYPSESGKRKECIGNFIVENLMDDKTDYSQEENQGKILKMLEDAKSKGTPGQAVDLIVFDPYTKLVGGSEDIETWKRIDPLMSKLRKMNLAIMIVHHSDEDGRCRGYANKKDNFAAIIKLWREGNKPATLDVPFEVKLEKGRNICYGKDFDAFDVKFEGETWTLASPEMTYEEEFCAIVESYKKENYDKFAIASMMGMGHSNCAKLFKLYKEEIKNSAMKKKPQK